MGDVVGADVSLDMMDSDQRLAGRQRVGFCCGQPDQQSSHQSRSVGHRDRVDLIHRGLRFFQRLIHNRVHVGQVMAGRDLGHDASVLFMYLDLG